MADRFPSLDDFDAGQTEVSTAPQTDDFLARERAALGDDAQLFASTDNPTATVADADSDDDDDDLLGGGGPSQPIASMNGDNTADDDMMGDFETSFPTISTGNEGVSSDGGRVTGSELPYRSTSTAPYTSTEDEEEPEVVTQWRERRAQAIESLDQRSASKKAEIVKAAQEAIDEFYENYNNRKDKQVAQTRKEAEEFLAKREDTTSGGTSWERIAKLVDLSGKGVGGGASGTQKARMREVLLDLRKDEHAPGATGV